MPDDRTRPMYPAGEPAGPDPRRDARSRGIQLGLLTGAVVVALVVVVLLLANRGGGGDPVVSESPTPEDSPTEEPTVTEEPTATEEPTETESPTEEPTGPRPATDADAAEFSESYRPEGSQAVESVTADIDGDGEKEVVFASIQSDSSRIDIAVWNGREYEVVYNGRGGGAERIDAFQVTDYTGDGSREIVTVQSVGAQGQSLSVWGWNGQAFAPQRASGGCWDGSHTFGVVGASISPGRIEATCDGSPLPTAAWPSHVYVWDAVDRGWVYDHTED